MTSTTTTTETTANSGDFNHDGEVSVADAVLLARFVAEDDTLTENQITDLVSAEPDLDEDGLVTIMDVMVLLKKLRVKSV